MINKIAALLNLKISKINQDVTLPSDFDTDHIDTFKTVMHNTMTSAERIYSLIESVKYITKNNIKGDIVECGVWKGGSMMAVAKTLMELNERHRNLYLYDTYEGMSAPTEVDKTQNDTEAHILLNKNLNKEKNNVWAYASFETVKKGMKSTNYPDDKIIYIKGKVEDTIPNIIPEKIAILRLDTDWYESTKHELIHLFPRLQKGGILILDDYGYWQGARKAVDEYFAEQNNSIFLARIDETGRIAVK
ncbi:MAG: TylF/MycF/NovP-related O-methyltransferase [Flavobacterium sp.]|nr:TylF/MycF/NovP-related O-methyltransferase [Flavobacterium sp.]